MSKIFVDGNCIVCDTEISYYKKIAPTLFEIVDISSPTFDATQFGLTSEAVQRHMHLQTTEGDVLAGIDAFAYIWSLIPKYHWAANVIKWPLVYQLSLVGYEIFARSRHLLPKRRPKN